MLRAPQELALQEPDKERLKALFDDLEFRALSQKLSATPPPAPAKKKAVPIQGDLFEGFGTEPAQETPVAEEEAETVQEETASYATSGASYHIADTPQKRAELIERLLQAQEVCLDTETTSTDALSAKLVGAVLPLAAKALKLDPAVMASPFITTIVDALSLLVYFLFATMLLGI